LDPDLDSKFWPILCHWSPALILSIPLTLAIFCLSYKIIQNWSSPCWNRLEFIGKVGFFSIIKMNLSRKKRDELFLDFHIQFKTRLVFWLAFNSTRGCQTAGSLS
jgi:hypothetical protein